MRVFLIFLALFASLMAKDEFFGGEFFGGEKKGKKEVEQAIYSSVDQKYGKNVKLVIHFDSQLTDFLSGTKAENINR